MSSSRPPVPPVPAAGRARVPSDPRRMPAPASAPPLPAGRPPSPACAHAPARQHIPSAAAASDNLQKVAGSQLQKTEPVSFQLCQNGAYLCCVTAHVIAAAARCRAEGGGAGGLSRSGGGGKHSLSLLDILPSLAGTQFACFTGKKVQILTLRAHRSGSRVRGGGGWWVCGEGFGGDACAELDSRTACKRAANAARTRSSSS
jgi:hypothetical protein